jgi:hypothetical protein
MTSSFHASGLMLSLFFLPLTESIPVKARLGNIPHICKIPSISLSFPLVIGFFIL